MHKLVVLLDSNRSALSYMLSIACIFPLFSASAASARELVKEKPSALSLRRKTMEHANMMLAVFKTLNPYAMAESPRALKRQAPEPITSGSQHDDWILPRFLEQNALQPFGPGEPAHKSCIAIGGNLLAGVAPG